MFVSNSAEAFIRGAISQAIDDVRVVRPEHIDADIVREVAKAVAAVLALGVLMTRAKLYSGGGTRDNY